MSKLLEIEIETVRMMLMTLT